MDDSQTAHSILQNLRRNAITKNEVNETFLEARNQLKHTYGLDLTIIEQAALRREIPNVISLSRETTGKTAWGFDYVSESITRFLMNYYGLPANFTMVHTSESREGKATYLDNPENFKEFLRRKQIREHFP